MGSEKLGRSADRPPKQQLAAAATTRNIKLDCLAILFLVASLFVLVGLASFDPADPGCERAFPLNPHVQNWCGSFGARLAELLIEVLGADAVVLVFAGVIAAITIFQRRNNTVFAWRMLGSALLVASGTALFQRAPLPFLSSAVGAGG